MKCKFLCGTAASLLALGLLFPGTPSAWAAHRRVRHRVKPVYPELARRMNIEGTVYVKVRVAPDGKVIEAKAVRGNSLLVHAAEEAVRGWRFVSADGSTEEKVEVEFDLVDYGIAGKETVSPLMLGIPERGGRLVFAGTLTPVNGRR